jgi:predicted enzyme related to lactoylglutathione lyase
MNCFNSFLPNRAILVVELPFRRRTAMTLLKRVCALALLVSLVSLAGTKSAAAPAAPVPQEKKEATMPTFKAPMINLYSRDLSRAVAFYSELGFVETFRTPVSGEPVHIELTLDGFTLGIATMEAAKEQHGLRPGGEGRGIEIVLWTDDADAAVNALVAKGAPLLSPAHDFLDGKLRSGWIADPDGNPIQLVQRRH